MKTFRFNYYTRFNGRRDYITIKAKSKSKAMQKFLSYDMKVILIDITEK